MKIYFKIGYCQLLYKVSVSKISELLCKSFITGIIQQYAIIIIVSNEINLEKFKNNLIMVLF
jgi:hypothetical protein